MSANVVYLLTGSNVGYSLSNLNQAMCLIEEQVGSVEQASSVYKTAPWGNTNQQDFYNQVLCVRTVFTAAEVLQKVLSVETQMGRKRMEKWGPRIIDIDVLLFNNDVIAEYDLIVPHPFMHQRKFTLVPLNELAPQLIHPKLNNTIHQLLEACADDSLVEKL